MIFGKKNNTSHFKLKEIKPYSDAEPIIEGRKSYKSVFEKRKTNFI
jgi:hypothetical protein